MNLLAANLIISYIDIKQKKHKNLMYKGGLFEVGKVKIAIFRSNCSHGFLHIRSLLNRVSCVSYARTWFMRQQTLCANVQCVNPPTCYTYQRGNLLCDPTYFA